MEQGKLQSINSCTLFFKDLEYLENAQTMFKLLSLYSVDVSKLHENLIVNKVLENLICMQLLFLVLVVPGCIYLSYMPCSDHVK